jgi:GntR family transcriptional regulator
VEQFNISPSSGVPIYKQLFSQIERMVLSGYFSQGDSLPSVRQVAADLEVNPMTVSKAYGLLEERGYLTRLRGKGMVVAKRDDEVSEQEKIAMLNKMIEKLIAEAEFMGISRKQLQQLITPKIAEANAKSISKKMNPTETLARRSK